MCYACKRKQRKRKQKRGRKLLKNGYIKLHRSLLDWEWYDDISTARVFIHLLLTANIADAKWHGTTIKRGARVISFRKLAEETNLSVKQVRTAINHLKRTQEVAHLPMGEFSVISIKNYEKFQGRAQQVAQQGQAQGTEGTKEGQQYKKNKEEKEEKENTPAGLDGTMGCPIPTGMTQAEYEAWWKEATA